MVYEKTVPFSGNTGKAMETARNILLPHGFRIITHSSSALEVAGLGILWPILWTVVQQPLVGVSKVALAANDREISIKAELGSVSCIVRYLVFFILAMAVFFVVLFGTISTILGQDVSKVLCLSLAPFIPWPVIIPLMAVWLKCRTRRALDSLVHNMVVMGK